MAVMEEAMLLSMEILGSEQEDSQDILDTAAALVVMGAGNYIYLYITASA